MAKAPHFPSMLFDLDKVRVCLDCHYPVLPEVPAKGGQPVCPICEGRNVVYLNPGIRGYEAESESVSWCSECGAPLWKDTTVCQVCFFDPALDEFTLDDFMAMKYGGE